MPLVSARSDWHGWQGHDADIQQLPHVPGHEFAGEIVEVGNGVAKWQPGDRVTMPFVAGCGTCADCVGGDPQVCGEQLQPGFTAWGSFAERVAIRYADANLVRIPDGMQFETAASLGCRVATAYRAVALQGQLRPGDWVAVFGCGGVGLSAVMVASALGGQPIAIDNRPEPLEMASRFGAAHVINASEVDNLPEAVKSVSSGGVHLSLDALGNRQLAADSILSLRKRGRHVQVGLLAGDDANPPLPMGPVIAHELEIVGSHGLAARHYPELLDLVSDGRIEADKLVTKTIRLDEAGDALASMDRFQTIGMTIINQF